MVKLPLDKQAHFWSGAAIAASVTLYTGLPWLAITLCALVAAGKELRDSMGYGTPDKWDFVATVAGCVVLLPLLII